MHSCTSDERRMTLRLLAYWEKLRGARAMPAELEIKADDIKDLWDYCFLARPAQSGYDYDYMGVLIADAFSHELQGSTNLSNAYAEVLENAKPVLEEGEFTRPDGTCIKFRQCLLPLGTGKAGAILGGLRYKSVAKQG